MSQMRNGVIISGVRNCNCRQCVFIIVVRQHNAVENFIVFNTVGKNVKETKKFTASEILRDLPLSIFNGDNSFSSQVTLVGKALNQLVRVDSGEGIIMVQRFKSSQGGKSNEYKFIIETT